MHKAQGRLDEFGIVLLAGFIMIAILMAVWTIPPATGGSFLNVTPKTIKTSTQINTSSFVLLDFNGTAQNVTLSVTGEIKNWISFDKNKFDVDGVETVQMEIAVPPSADNRTYSSNLLISFDTQKLTIPITVIVSAVPVENTELFSLGSFSVSGGAVESLDSKKSIAVSQGYFSGNRVNLFFNTPASKLDRISEGMLTIFVDDTNSLGNLVVTLNDQTIFNKKVGLGELKIPINKSLLKDSNTITISAGSPGWTFWASTEYKLRSADIGIIYPSETKEFAFSLTRNQVENFKYARVTFSVKNYQLPLSNFKVLINNQLVYIHDPPLVFFRDLFSKTIFGDDLILTAGSNKISFEFDKQGFYEVTDATLVVAYGG